MMVIDTSILLDDHFDNFISSQIERGRFSSVSEVVRAALQLVEYVENQKNELAEELEKGEKSGFVRDINRKSFIKNLHSRHLDNGLLSERQSTGRD